MHPTRNDLPARTRIRIEKLLNQRLADRLADFGRKVRYAIAAAAKLEDADTSDQFTGVSRDVDKYLWFLEAHLQAAR